MPTVYVLEVGANDPREFKDAHAVLGDVLTILSGKPNAVSARPLAQYHLDEFRRWWTTED